MTASDPIPVDALIRYAETEAAAAEARAAGARSDGFRQHNEHLWSQWKMLAGNLRTTVEGGGQFVHVGLKGADVVSCPCGQFGDAISVGHRRAFASSRSSSAMRCNSPMLYANGERYPDSIRWSDLSDYARRSFRNGTMAVCEVDVSHTAEWVDEGTPGARKASGGWVLHTDRTKAETIAAEAEVYLLINRGGVPHEDGDLDAARAITGGDNR